MSVRKYVPEMGGDATASVKLAYRLYKIGRFNECARLGLEIVGRTGAKDKSSQKLMALVGESLIEVRRYADAVCVYSDIIKRWRPRYAFVNRAFARCELGKHGLALRDYRTAIRMDCKDSIVLRCAGDILIRLGRPEEAIRFLKMAINIDSLDGRALRLLGVAYGKLDLWVDSYSAYRRAMDIDPSDVVARSALDRIDLYFDLPASGG